jgi:hypothetical protein
MAKNMTRKGLALGAGLALVSSALVAAPAQAAGELTLEPTAGTSWSVPSTSGFGVKAYFTAGYSSSEAAKLKYRVTAAGGYKVDADTSTSAVYAATTDLIASTGTSGTIATAGGSPTYAAFAVESASASTTYSITVQAYIDADSDSTIDTGEWTSAVQTITFLKHADVNWTVDIVDPVRGATTATVRVTSTNINLAQLDTSASGDLDSQVAAVFYDGTTLLYTDATSSADGGSYAGASGADGDNAAEAMSYDAVNDRLTATSAATTALAVGDTIKADIYFEATAAAEASGALDRAVGGTDGLATGTANDTVAATRTEAVPAAQLTALGAVTSTATANNTATSGAAVSVRTGATSVVATATATLSAGVSSTDVTFTVSEQGANTVDAAASITSGGKTLTNSNAGTTQTIDVVVKTDADGVATLTLTLAGLKAGNAFTVVGAAQGYTATLATYTVADAVATSAKNLNAVGVNADSSRLVFPTGSGFDLRYAVLDQFGALLTVAGHSVTVSDGTNSWSAALSGGYATVSIPSYASATTKTMTPTVYKNGVDVSITEPTALVRIGAAGTVATVTGTGDSGTTSGSPKALNLKANAAKDTRIGETAPSVTANTNVVITGSAKDSNLDGVDTSVTLSGAGLMFEADGVWTVGSITVQTTAAGAYTVDVYSNKSGKQVVTITSGSATTTEDLFFAAAGADSGTAVSFAGTPTSVTPGTNFNVFMKLTDTYGNNVNATAGDIKVTYAGLGIPLSTLPNDTDASGEASFTVLVGSGTGTGTVTFTFDADADGTVEAADGDFTSSYTITIAAVEPVAKIGSFNGRVAVRVENAKGSTISVKIGRQWYKYNALNNNYLQSWKSRKGASVAVSVYVDGELQNVQTITVK